ncbi:hypothetical protein ACIMS2_005234 [Vibrio harveyi]
MYTAFRPSQPSLVSAIMTELAEQNPDLGMDAALMNKVIEAANLVVDECSRDRVYATSPMTPQEWLKSDDVGLSSKYMLTVLADLGFPADDGDRPHDACDLGRCIRMVRACGFEDKVEKMRGRGKCWTRIAENWEMLVQWYDAQKGEDIYNFLNQ